MGDIVIQLFITGLAMGCIYGIVGLGFIQVYNAVGVTNFAQGEFVMLGAYLMYTAVEIWNLPQWAAIIIMMVGMGIFAFIFTKLVYVPLRYAGLLAIILATVGISMSMQDSAVLTWGPTPLYLTRIVSEDPIILGNIVILPQHLLIISTTVALLLIEFFLFQKTSLGRMMRATAQDQEAAALVGIKVPAMISMTFINSSILAGIAGFLVGPIFSVSPSMGFSAMIKGFIGCTIGGWGNIPGTILGGIIVGMIEIFGAYFISSSYRDAIVFGVLILFLVLRPQGIFGELIAEKV